MNTDTPRTDTPRTDEISWIQSSEEIVEADFARQLERELTAVTEHRDELLLDMIRGKIAIPDRSELEYITQLKAVTEQRDRLAVALERILEYQGRFAEEDPESIAREALQSLTTNEQ